MMNATTDGTVGGSGSAEPARLGLSLVRTRMLDDTLHDHYGVAMRDPEGNEFDIN